MATPAPSCRKALTDATTAWPNRNRASDGIMGDAAHQGRPSDHNLGNAFDLTHDVGNGVDCRALSRLVMNDPRVKYVIFAGQIYRTYRPAQGWAAYTGQNSHHHHMHVSIKADSRNDLSAWPWSNGAPAGGGTSTEPVTGGAPAYPGTVIKQESRGADVRAVQQRLKDLGFTLDVDGNFGPGTLAQVKAFQRQKGLGDDGKVGPATWAALFAN